MQEYISTGIENLNSLIYGYPCDGISTIYGPGSSGKTNLVLIAAIAQQKQEKKIIIINTEGKVMIDRLQQLIEDKNLQNFIFLEAKNFEEQDKIITELCNAKLTNISLILFDSSNKLLRAEFSPENKKKFKEQLNKLKNNARTKKIPTILTAQVYCSYKIEKDVIFAGDILNEFSDCIFELNILDKKRKLTVKKHNNIMGEKVFLFKIEKKGIIPIIPQ